MTIPFGRACRSALLAAACLVAVEANHSEARAGGWISLAQAPAPAVPVVARPSGRMFVVEGIVIVVLFAGAVFGVCRSSGRS